MKMKELESWRRFEVPMMMLAEILMTSFVMEDSHKYSLKSALVLVDQSLDVYSMGMYLTSASLLSTE